MGLWDVESAGDQWAGDNAFFYSYSMYCRNKVNEPFEAGDFCLDKETGSYENENGDTVICDNDLFNGGWTKVFHYQDTAATTGDMSPSKGNLPFWYRDNLGGCNQYMWVDSGTTLDFAVGSGSWHSEGYDAEKHIFTTDKGYIKVRDRGSDTTWSFANNCADISSYMLEDQSGVCQHGADNKPANCGKKAFFDFSTEDSVPMITGMWDLESAGGQWTGDNAFYYAYSLYCRKLTRVPFDPKAFCDGKETGDYINDNYESVYCDNDSFGGGWSLIYVKKETQ
jgi:hypothetical protein